MRKYEENTGITLIALVVTIIVLLILAGVSISMLTGQNGILNRVADAKEKTEVAQKDEEEKMQGYESLIDQYTGTIPEGLKVGSEVTYAPSGTYNWQAKYCSSEKTEGTDDVTLNSASGQSYNITEWKVLSIENGKVELVPTNPTEGTVYLGQAQGYNNGVKLLNDACSSLYGNTSKGITARSLNIDDIEKYMSDDKLAEVHQYQYTSGGGVKYGTQLSSAYTSNKNYPSIYAKENLSVINGNKKTDGLGMSEQSTFVEKTDDGETDGKITTATSIQPYQTLWWKDNAYMQIAFRIAKGETNYYDLLIPQGSRTNYWVASHCVEIYPESCDFYMRKVRSGDVGSYLMYNSSGITNNDSCTLFPVVSLNASLLSKNADGEFTVNVD